MQFYLSYHLYIVACAGAGATVIALVSMQFSSSVSLSSGMTSVHSMTPADVQYRQGWGKCILSQIQNVPRIQWPPELLALLTVNAQKYLKKQNKKLKMPNIVLHSCFNGTKQVFYSLNYNTFYQNLLIILVFLV